ncbi:MOSC domain-containing protein [Durotheca rogersii]|uniref:MOSC domain-containing protein n=1 Tax=Durotheca rogersii TaxID=419775 RepID=UPI00221E78B7|nr:MOSC domain-containing protein [Durotheca rogersii]KAI5868450.1 MOSC domain-containing protein [Durotheca rogersii]
MEITELYICPIKALRPLSVRSAQLCCEGLRHDRRFMLLKVDQDPAAAGGSPVLRYRNVQTPHFPEGALFYQTVDEDGGVIVVTHRAPRGDSSGRDRQEDVLCVPLSPVTDGCERIDITLFGSPATTYRMGDPYDAWFSSRLGRPVVLVYIGDNRRPVLAHAPRSQRHQAAAVAEQSASWLSLIGGWLSSYGSPWGEEKQETGEGEEGNGRRDGGTGGLTFNEAAPYLVTSRASLRDVSARLPEGEAVDMIKFRPNIVVGGAGDPEGADRDAPAAWDEDFWAELLVGGRHRLALTANCARCVSINIDYETGRPAEGEMGTVLKKLMKDRRVDKGNRWSPIFGRYAFLLPPSPAGEAGLGPTGGHDGGEARKDGEGVGLEIAVGDEVTVTRRISERDTWAWPK